MVTAALDFKVWATGLGRLGLSGKASWERQELSWDLGGTQTPKPDQADEEDKEAKAGRQVMVGIPRRTPGPHHPRQGAPCLDRAERLEGQAHPGSQVKGALVSDSPALPPR